MKPKVLDAYALMAFYENEPGADTVRELILSAEKGTNELSMTAINLGEVWYSLARNYSSKVADHYVHEVEAMAIEIVPADWSLAYQAAQFKAGGHLSYADCFAAALAKLKNAELVTGDKEFKSLQDQIKVHWI